MKSRSSRADQIRIRMDSLAGCSRWRVGVLVKDIEERRLQARYHFDRCFWEHQNS